MLGRNCVRLLTAATLTLLLTACRTAAGTTLQLEQHLLTGAPSPDPLSFEPVDEGMQNVLDRHADLRASRFHPETTTYQGNPALLPLGIGSDLLAVLITSTQDPPQQTAEVIRNGQSIFSTSAGLPSPVFPLIGLWSYGNHWALEILYATPEAWRGEIYIDGESVNAAGDYDEVFGFQLLAGKPFYFTSHAGQIGYSFGGQLTDLGFDQVTHYNCCAESTLNPVQAEQMVAFFAQRGQDWYYVELGDF